MVLKFFFPCVTQSLCFLNYSFKCQLFHYCGLVCPTVDMYVPNNICAKQPGSTVPIGCSLLFNLWKPYLLVMCVIFVWLHLHTDPFMQKFDLARAIGSQQGQFHCPPCWNVVIVVPTLSSLLECGDSSPYTVLLVGMW